MIIHHFLASASGMLQWDASIKLGLILLGLSGAAISITGCGKECGECSAHCCAGCSDTQCLRTSSCELFPHPFVTECVQKSSQHLNYMAVVSFTRYPGYTGALNVAGGVKIRKGEVESEAQSFEVDLTGTDGACDAEVSTRMENRCNVAIHEGLTCSDAANIGEHYWNKETVEYDPWANMQFMTENKNASTTFERVTGLEMRLLAGHALVITDSSGTRIACGLVSWALVVGSFQPYPNYRGSLRVTGHVVVQPTRSIHGGLGQFLAWNLQGADPECANGPPSGEKAACGIHIHEGTDCADATTIGGHFWDPTTYNDDPWASIHYSSKAYTAAVITGYLNAAVAGHVVVVHDSSGARVACGQLSALLVISDLAPQTAYKGHLRTTGSMSISEAGNGDAATQFLTWSLSGADPRCTDKACRYKNCCAIRVLVDTNCSDANDANDESYWNKDAVQDDPWALVRYVASEGGSAHGRRKVTTGFNNHQYVGHVTGIHDYDGRLVACGQLVAPPAPFLNFESGPELARLFQADAAPPPQPGQSRSNSSWWVLIVVAVWLTLGWGLRSCLLNKDASLACRTLRVGFTRFELLRSA